MKVAHVIETGFDERRLLRYVVYALEPPMNGLHTYKRLYSATDIKGLPIPMTDELIAKTHIAIARSLGYELIADSD